MTDLCKYYMWTTTSRREWNPSDPCFYTLHAACSREWAFLFGLDGSSSVNETVNFSSSTDDNCFIFHTFLFSLHDEFLAKGFFLTAESTGRPQL